MGTAFNTPASGLFTTWIPSFPLVEETQSPELRTPVSVKKAGPPAGFVAPAQPTAAAGNVSSRDQIVLDNLHLVKGIAYRVRERLPVHVDLDDLVHAGVLGLMDAASKFDPEKQVAFSSYAKHRIKGAILDNLRQMDSASRDIRKRHRQIEAATRDLASELKRTPAESEIAERLGLGIDRLRQTVAELHNLGLLSANTRSTEHEDMPEPEYPSAPESRPDHICGNEQRSSALDRAMTSLPDRYKQVIKMYYTNELTMKEIGQRLNINESRVSQIHKAALEKMNVALRTAGITSANAF